jgi:pilus assembly protein CpaB
MRVVTIVSLGASAVLGLAALFVAKAVLPNAGQKPVAGLMQQQPPAGVPIVAAKADLKFGDRLEAGKLAILHVPANAVPVGAFSTIEQVLAQDHGGPPVALTQIAAKEVLLPAKLSGPGARPSVAVTIAEGFRAYTIKVSDVTGVGGLVLPGDRVDVVLMRDLTPNGDTRTFVSDVIIQNVRILGIDLNADLTANKPATPNNATLEVSVPDAQKLAVASDLGKLSLAMRKTGAAELERTGPMRTGNFLSGGVRSDPARPSTGFGGPRLILIVEGGPHGKGGGAKRAPRPTATPPAPVPDPEPKPNFALIPLSVSETPAS